MSSRMMKWLLLASVLLIVLPVVAGASTSRLAGMGTQGDYVKDYTNMFGYPSCVAGVGNLVYGEFGTVAGYYVTPREAYTTGDHAVGAVLGNLFDGRYGTLAFNLREFSPALGAGFQPMINWGDYNLGTGFETFDSYIDPNGGDNSDGYSVEAFDLLWGKKLSNMSLGVRLNRSAYKNEYGDPVQTETGYSDDNRDIFGFGAGVGFEMTPQAKTEIGVLYQSRTYKHEYTSYTDESDGGGAYLVSARMMWQTQPSLLIVPVIRFYSFDLSSKDTPTDGTETKYEETVAGWQAGVAGDWTLNQNDLFVAGVTFASNVDDQKTDKIKYTETSLPTLFASLETHLNSWLTLRFGGRKGVFYSTKEENTNTEGSTTTTNWSPFQFFTGVGVKLGTLQFDATLAQDFFQNPSTYLMGNNKVTEAGPEGTYSYSPALFPKVTATYTF
jgi:hypothetical protein